jgi:tRNA-dihydrouridine synthase 1
VNKASSIYTQNHTKQLSSHLHQPVPPLQPLPVVTIRPFAQIAIRRLATMATSTPPAKLHGYDFYKSIGSPQYVIAPMVDQSELVGIGSISPWTDILIELTSLQAWRVLSRQPIPPSYEALQSATPTTTTTSIVSSDSSTSSSSSTKYPIGGAHLCYTPMIHAKLFAQDEGSTRQSFTSEQFDFTNGEEGSSEPLAGLQVSDRPLFVQVSVGEE